MRGGTAHNRVLMALAAVGFAMCGWLPVNAGPANDTMVVAIEGEIPTLDHLYTTARDTITLAELTDDGLFYVDPETLAYVPAAAESYVQVDDTTIDVTIRPGVRFHDGSPLTADDVVYTFSWVLDPDTKTNRGRVIGAWLDRVERTGPMQVRFHLKHPYPLAIRDMAFSVQLRKKGAYHPDGKADPNAQAQMLNGIGPYKVVDFQPGKRVTLERFDGYYADSPKGRPAIRHIVFRTIPDLSTQQAELISGNVDWMYNVPADIASNLGATGYATHLTGPTLRVNFIPLDAAGYTGADNPLTKLDVRRAMIHAINRRDIVKYLIQGDAEVIDSACHPLQFGCEQDVRKYPYDTAEARRLLAGAGYPNGFEVELWAYRERQSAEAVAADLAKVGIRVRLRFVTLTTLNQARKNHRVPAFFASWESGSTADTATIAEVHWSLKSDRNLSKDAVVARQMEAAARTIDAEERKRLYSAALKRIADQAYWIPLYTYSQNYLVSNTLAFPVTKDGLPRLFRAHWRANAVKASN
ncbi:MAG: ABC transporter substrate-binding protein [Xanthobacteraceae bacterium]|nr:ABC transporter substrate-binding protein [Xanthobacteraceae bacterium]MBX3547914.1 ABC transporter substrate-binding protein [Xanthobacteraceae bacterium]